MKSISGKKLCRVLRKHGWVKVRTKGSHFAFRHPDRPETIVVPVHGNHDLKPGTLAGIMKDAGLSRGDIES